MDIQTILTVAIVAVAVFFAIRHLWHSLNPKRDDNAPHCSCGCDGCSFNDTQCTYKNSTFESMGS